MGKVQPVRVEIATMPGRAKEPESTKPDERATLAESTILAERAMSEESTIRWERANKSESTKLEE